MSKLYPRFVKERAVWAASELLLRVGCEITETRDGDRVLLDVFIPPDPDDPHGERFKAMQENAAAAGVDTAAAA